jgi:hypothetical protein
MKTLIMRKGKGGAQSSIAFVSPRKGLSIRGVKPAPSVNRIRLQTTGYLQRQASIPKICALLLALSFLPLYGTATDEKGAIPKEIESKVEAVRRYLLKEDYPELFKDKPYRVRIEDVLVADIDNDGNAEVVTLFQPHYRQTPTVAFFQLDKELKVKRVFEGLAPGPLVPVSGQYLDSHTIGMAIDVTATAKPGTKPLQPQHLVEAARKNRLRGLVQYRTFFHADGREGTGSYVDMTHLDVPNHEDTCAHFEFSRVKDIAVGTAWISDPRLHIAARVENEIYIYRIDRIDDGGFLDKKVWVMQTPLDFQAFLASFEPRAADTPLLYKTTVGETRQLPMENATPMPNRSMQPTAASGG